MFEKFTKNSRSVTSDCRGETEPLYDTNTKEQGSENWAKFCCWIFILALLAGAIAVGVMIGSKLVKSLIQDWIHIILFSWSDQPGAYAPSEGKQ